MRGLTVEEVGEFGGFPMETLLLISNAFDRIPGRFFDFGLACRCQFTIFGNEAAIRAAHFPRQHRSEEHTSELQSLMRISSAVFCLKKKKTTHNTDTYAIQLTDLNT